MRRETPLRVNLFYYNGCWLFGCRGAPSASGHYGVLHDPVGISVNPGEDVRVCCRATVDVEGGNANKGFSVHDGGGHGSAGAAETYTLAFVRTAQHS